MRQLILAAVLLPGIGAVDPRVKVDPDETPWRALGRVQTELGARCTGFLVGPRTVLTAAHCLYRPTTGHFVQPGSVHFVLGYDMGQFVAHARVRAFITGPGWATSAPGKASGADWAALTLDTPLGTPDRVLKVAEDLARPGEPAMLGGYSKDRAEVIEADRSCRVLGLVRDAAGRALIVHGCAGTSGTSGAPLLVRDGNGWAVVGIEVAAVAGQSKGVAVPIPSELQ